MNKLTKKAIVSVLAALFSVGAPLSMGDIRIGDTPARRIAKEATLRGKYVEGQCLPFALALHARLRAAGIPSKIISFRYETLPRPREIFGERRAIAPINERGGITGDHAVVAYEDRGRTYVMDNQSWQPKWIHDDSPFGMARQFTGMDAIVAKVRVVDNPRSSYALAGRTRASHLFRAHAPSLRLQFVAQSSGRLRLRTAAAVPLYGFAAPKRREPLREESFPPLREESFLQERSPGFCRNDRRSLFRVSLLALR